MLRKFFTNIIVAGACFGLATPANAQNSLQDVPDSLTAHERTFLAAYYAGGGWSRVDMNSTFGIGTVVNPAGESFLVRHGDHIDRGGMNASAAFVDLQQGVLFGSGPASLVGTINIAKGNMRRSGNATVGQNGVTQVGHTFPEPVAGFGTGRTTATAGDVLTGSINQANFWFDSSLQYRETAALGNAAAFLFSVGPSVEVFNQDFGGRSDISRGGAVLETQEISSALENTYYGLRMAAGIAIQAANNVTLSFEGYVIPSYNDYSAKLTHTQTAAGTQNFSKSGDEFSVSGGLRARVNWNLAPGFSLTAGYEYSVLADVATVDYPASPNQQPFAFGHDDVNRHLFDVAIRYASDARLKRDIEHVQTLDSGVKLYAYRYVWGETRYVGVMAQDLLADPARRDAVITMPNGYYAVDYGKLGLAMPTLTAWQAKGSTALTAIEQAHASLSH